MSFLGRDVTLNIFSPDAESPIISPQTRTVLQTAVEFADTSDFDSTDPNDRLEVVNADINVSRSSIVYTIDDRGGVFSDVSGFNGFVISDAKGTVPAILDVQISTSGNDLGITSDRIFFNADTISVNVSGLTYQRSDQIVLLVTFREPRPGPILGTEADDSLSGTENNDRINGLGGSDIVDGGAGDDFLLGEEGSDVLVGGAGKDLLRGGADADRFVFNLASESLGRRSDVVADFEQGADKIDLRVLDADIGTSLNQAFSFIGRHAFTGTAGELRYSYLNNPGTSDDRTIVHADTNGDRRTDLNVSLARLLVLTSDDFIL